MHELVYDPRLRRLAWLVLTLAILVLTGCQNDGGGGGGDGGGGY